MHDGQDQKYFLGKTAPEKFGLSLSIYRNMVGIKLLTHVFFSLSARRWIEFAILLRTSQSVHAKSTVYLCGIY